MKILVVLMLTLFVLPVNAKVYKCKVNGQTKYQQVLCPEDSSSGGVIEVKANVTSTAGLRQHMEQDRVAKMLREQKERERMAARQAHFNREVDRSMQAREGARIRELERIATTKTNSRMDLDERLDIRRRAKQAERELGWRTPQDDVNDKMRSEVARMRGESMRLQAEMQLMKHNAMFGR